MTAVPAEIRDFVDNAIKSHKVAVFSKSYCPYCHKAKNALAEYPLKEQDFFWLEIEKRPDVAQIQDYLLELTGGRTVPRVFLAGEFFGGGNETEAAHNDGQLAAKLKAIGAL